MHVIVPKREPGAEETRMHVVEVLLLAGSGQQAAMPWLLLDTPGTASYRVSNRCRSIVPVSALLLSTDAVCAQVILQLMPTYLTPTATAVCIHLGTNVPAASGNRAVQRSTPRTVSYTHLTLPTKRIV